MRITSIELAGTSNTKLRHGSPGLPRAFAKISRTTDSEYMEVTIIRPECADRKHMVQADDADDQWSMAECLQETLDGYRGTNSEIEEYVRVLRHFAD